MIEHNLKEDILNILRILSSSSRQLNQRDLSSSLGISLGKTNYLIKELIKKGLVKAKNFSAGDDKFGKIRYILTKEGMDEYLQLTYDFLQRKEAEYLSIREEWQKISSSKNMQETTEPTKEKTPI